MKNDHISSPVAGCMRWGKWGANFSTEQYRQMIENCLAYGIYCFDHADIYGDYTTESDFGEALKEDPSLRHRMKLITKCGIKMMCSNRPEHSVKSYDTSKEHILYSVEQSLKKFRTDYIDILLIHRPDPLLNPAEVASAVEHLKSQGKIISFGVSNFIPSQVNLLSGYTTLDYNQFEFSLIHTQPLENGILDNCMSNAITPMAWAPLGGGLLTEQNHPRFRAITTIATELALKYDTGLNEILLAWIHSHPAKIQTVLGTTKIQRLVQARDAATISLEREDWFKLLEASHGEDVA